MIPKMIHYCWFGGAEKPSLAKKCIASWKKFCPDYEIIEWNETNIDIQAMPDYVKEAYEAQKWGFVPDYIRLWLVYTYGGIYLDTDVEIIKSFDQLLSLHAFCGFESKEYVNFGLGFGAEKGNARIKKVMDSYLEMHFRNEDGTLNLIPSPVLNTKALCECGLIQNNSLQNLENMMVYPMEYFCPMDYQTRLISKTKNTYSIHRYSASWFPPDQKAAYRRSSRRKRIGLVKEKVRSMIGTQNYERLKRLIGR